MSELDVLIYKKLGKIQKQLNQIEQTLSFIMDSEEHMTAELDALTAEVNEVEGVMDSAVVLLQGLSDYIREHANDPAALTALADSLEAKEQALAQAIANNPVPAV
jgi:hypothetical protein